MHGKRGARIIFILHQTTKGNGTKGLSMAGVRRSRPGGGGKGAATTTQLPHWSEKTQMVNSLTNILPKYIWERFSISPIKIPSKFGAVIFWFVMFSLSTCIIYIYINTYSRGFFLLKSYDNDNLQKEAFWKTLTMLRRKTERSERCVSHRACWIEAYQKGFYISAAVISLDFSEKCSFKSRI